MEPQILTIPVFPLQLVLFEQEELNLHIFEPRYRRLIKTCTETGNIFGIPVVAENKLQGTGTTARVKKVVHSYPDGESDIVCTGLNRFVVIDYMASADQTVAATALVELLPFADNEDKELNMRITDLLNALLRLRDSGIPAIAADKFHFYHWVHKCGLSLEKELEMVSLESTAERQLYMLDHLKRLFASSEEIQRMQQMVRLNGHFKKLNQSF